MYEKSRAYEDDPTVKLVILKANGKVFCCGGDLASGYTYVQLGHWSFGASYYRKEFCLDYLLATYKKPLLAILDGSVIGGGVGISIHSTFRIVTENTIFAMPEVLIGAFPDVGASYFLSRLPGFFGEYVGLTGARLNGAEMLVFGLGTHFVPSKVFVLVQCYQEYI
ncbi:putative 3-hydroxyisobutyryl-CoA hydrolase [Helianthus annuus]|nr:putative 3-hydroxyisobutyryl-CoA hydrolase [Helianthus annuus]KAJ0523082.1 putative 3-hydroxyisobutyryl-CoA hydrolase [Helianthus annuus]KAJ0530944.1 putative 3-hydroxyisobutyryl-CoA hydrolase [Helianthus annuus]KAJ0701168.1 putative 3-hydroxyisobutyryl-CoA hydrolase [Helianthus annuus]